MIVSPWHYPPNGAPYRTLSFQSKRELYSFLIRHQLEREQTAFVHGAITGRAITLNQINHAWKPVQHH